MENTIRKIYANLSSVNASQEISPDIISKVNKEILVVRKFSLENSINVNNNNIPFSRRTELVDWRIGNLGGRDDCQKRHRSIFDDVGPVVVQPQTFDPSGPIVRQPAGGTLFQPAIGMFPGQPQFMMLQNQQPHLTTMILPNQLQFALDMSIWKDSGYYDPDKTPNTNVSYTKYPSNWPKSKDEWDYAVGVDANIEMIKSFVKDRRDRVSNDIKQNPTANANNIRLSLQSVDINGTAEAINAPLDMIQKQISDLIKQVGDILNNFTDGLVDMVSDLIKNSIASFGDAAQPLLDAIQKVIDRVVDIVSTQIKGILSTLQELLNKLIQASKEILAEAIKAAKEIADKLVRGILVGAGIIVFGPLGLIGLAFL